MLPVENETILEKKKLNDEVNKTELVCSSSAQKNSIQDITAHCSEGIRVTVVAEINENCNSIDVITEVNGTEESRKRTADITENLNSKRRRSSEDAVDNLVQVNQDPEPSRNISTFDLQNENIGTTCNNHHLAIKIKSEPLADSNEECSANGVCPSSSGTSNPNDIKPAIKVEKADASSTSRESCRFGIRCYRRNPMHRKEEAHPGDNDYRRPSYPAPPEGTPGCPYGDLCYRRNPIHFERFNHPPETDFEKNYSNYRLRLRQRRQQRQRTGDDTTNTSTNSSELEEDYDLDDPFINDEELDSDYIPNSNDEEDEDDYDACDRAEE